MCSEFLFALSAIDLYVRQWLQIDATFLCIARTRTPTLAFHTLFMLTHLTPDTAQVNQFSFVHLHSVHCTWIRSARQTVADSCFAVCMARSVWPCLYRAHTFFSFAHTLSSVLPAQCAQCTAHALQHYSHLLLQYYREWVVLL